MNHAEGNVMYLLNCKVVFIPVFCCLKMFIGVETLLFVEIDIMDNIAF
jgi:hypothetical protein